MLDDKVMPYSRDIFEWGRRQDGANLIPVSNKKLIMTLLPRTKAKFSRTGLIVFGLRYDCKERNFTEEYLSKQDAIVAYNPESVDVVYLLEKGEFIEFQLIESRFVGKSFEEVRQMIQAQKELVKQATYKNLQGRIDLTSQIEIIVGNISRNIDINLKNIRESREREKKRQHRDFVKEIVNE